MLVQVHIWSWPTQHVGSLGEVKHACSLGALTQDPAIPKGTGVHVQMQWGFSNSWSQAGVWVS